MKEEKIILGIDPGTNIMGYGVILANGNTMQLLDMGVVYAAKMDDGFEKLRHIFQRICALIDTHQPVELAIEAPFFGKNVQSMLKLGRAQGTAIAAALSKGLMVYEYSPRKIKQSITGKGSATKEQVAAMLERLLLIKEKPEFLDATDGLAAAVCHHFQFKPGTTAEKAGKKSYTGWKAFIAENPGRTK